jgi:hypothetical protein
MLLHQTYSQNDPRWRDMLLGSSRVRMGDYGCLVTAIANSLPAYAIDRAELDGDMTAKETLTRLNAVGAFALDGNLDTQKVEQAFPQLTRFERVYTKSWPVAAAFRMDVPVALARIRRLIDLGQPVILHVDASPANGRPTADHFVTLVDYGEWLIVDSWDGRRIRLAERYGAPDKAIQGYLAFLGPSVECAQPWAANAAWKLSQYLKEPVRLRHYATEALQHIING